MAPKDYLMWKDSDLQEEILNGKSLLPESEAQLVKWMHDYADYCSRETARNTRYAAIEIVHEWFPKGSVDSWLHGILNDVIHEIQQIKNTDVVKI